jgi:lipoate---protein ligase
VTALRLLDLGGVGALRSQAIYHALCYSISEGMPATLAVLYPTQRYACIGYHRALEEEVDMAFCRERGIPVYRRRVGGGTVYLDADQIFFQLILPARDVRGSVAQTYVDLLAPAVAAYRALGISEAAMSGVNDIAVHGRRLSGTGMARIADAVVLVGNVIMDFPTATMARIVKLPDEFSRAWVEASMRRWLSSVWRETRRRPPYAEVANALRVAFGDWSGGRLEPAGLTSAEEAHITRVEARLGSTDWLRGEGRATGQQTPEVRRVKIRAGRYDAIFDTTVAGEAVRTYVSADGGEIEAARICAPESGRRPLQDALRDLSVALTGQCSTSERLAWLIRDRLVSSGVAQDEAICFAQRLASAARADD